MKPSKAAITALLDGTHADPFSLLGVHEGPKGAFARALLPGVELLLAAGLLLGFAPLAPMVAIALLLVFAAAMAINIGRGRRHIDCGCGHSGLRQQLGWSQVARNLVLATALLPALAAGRADLGMADVGLGAAAGVALYLLLLMFSAVGALVASAPKQG